MEGQFSSPVRVIAFNTAEGWSHDVSAEVADEIARRCAWRASTFRRYWSALSIDKIEPAAIAQCFP